MYVVLQTTDDVKEGEVVTFYLIGEELTLPVDAKGQQQRTGGGSSGRPRDLYYKE